MSYYEEPVKKPKVVAVVIIVIIVLAGLAVGGWALWNYVLKGKVPGLPGTERPQATNVDDTSLK